MTRLAGLVQVLAWLSLTLNAGAAADRPPNIVVIFCDDLGYGDLGCFGHPTIRTPHLDRVAAEGQKWTSFYVAAPVCTPSRAGLLTGRLPIRNGMTSPTRAVLFPDSGGGLPLTEITLAECLKAHGYATACIGKWHLGHLAQFLPMQQGFDEYYGIPYSNDMHANGGVPSIRGAEVVERPTDQTKVTQRYTQHAVRFIREHQKHPFFLYLPHTMPHIPLFASDQFRNTSPRGLYGDVVEEIDDSVGTILAALRDNDCGENTLLVFTSDNGPWLSKKLHGGSAGLLRAGKGTTFEGGMRVPTIFWWPTRIAAGSQIEQMGCTTDLMATFCALTGAEMPKNRTLDSFDLTPALLGTGDSPRDHMFYYTRGVLHAARLGAFKMHLITRDPVHYGRPTKAHDPPLLYNVEVDPSEQHDLADKHPEIVAKLRALIAEHQQTVTPAIDQLAIPLP